MFNSGFKGCDHPYADSVRGRNNEICASADDDRIAVAGNGADNFKKVLKLDPTSAIDYANIASNYREMGNRDMAIRFYKFALNVKTNVLPKTVLAVKV